MGAWGEWALLVVTHLDAILLLLGLLGVLVGALVYVLRNPGTHLGIARQYEEEGNIEAALRHYRKALRLGAGRIEGRAARTRVSELSDRAAQEARRRHR